MTALVTGAGSGIGNRLAELLLTRGDQVIALDVKFSDAAREALKKIGPAVHFEEVDVRDGDAVKAAVEAGVAALGAPRLVINSAGVVIAVPFEETDEAAFRRVVDVNLYGSRNVAAATVPYLKNGGHLVLIASLAGFIANYGYSAYCASKFGVVGLAEVLRLEQKPNGVEVSVVAPPEVVTPMVEEERRSGSKLTGEMKQFAGSMELEPAAAAILKGIDAGGFLVIPSAKGRATRLLNQFAPKALTHGISDRLLRKASQTN
ncbi:MAG: SDR family NAD(P)-dependent oxidoreductase [Thermoleophilaceae bacterium]|nr:SDR family NAD(P)-dependent oxidoreductase [Thermoleophilaceae bacterium]